MKALCPECGRPFIKARKKQVCCSPECQAERERKKDTVRAEAYRAYRKEMGMVTRSQMPAHHDGQERGSSRTWKGYMRQNRVYFQGLFPGKTVEEAAKLMKLKRFLLC